MKIKRSETITDIQTLPKSKARVIDNGEVENLWVAVDKENDKMYFLNHSIAFYPYPTWGSEHKLSKELDITEFKGESPEDLELTLHPAAYDVMPLIEKDGVTYLDAEKWFGQKTDEEE